MLGPRGGFVVAASAVAAAAWQEFEHRRVDYADLKSVPVRVARLSELRDDPENLALIDAGLRKEWGPFALLGFESLDEMLSQAGNSTFIGLVQEDVGFVAKAALQTTFVDAHGAPELLRDAYASFESLTSAEAMHRAARKGGDTAVLLQITVFGNDNRGLGLGTLLRDAALNMLEEDVAYALTATPVDVAPGKPALSLDDSATFTPAMRFHGKGGAVPTVFLPGYKTPPEGETSSHGGDVIVMRYARDDEHHWPVDPPDMRLHRMGPLQKRFVYTRRHLKLPHVSLRRLYRRHPVVKGPEPEIEGEALAAS
jgi:hypothetical protein